MYTLWQAHNSQETQLADLPGLETKTQYQTAESDVTSFTGTVNAYEFELDDSTGGALGTTFQSVMFNHIYPIGAILINEDADPDVPPTFPGTWTKIDSITTDATNTLNVWKRTV